MGNFLSRIRELLYYTDAEPLEIMGGLFRVMTLLHPGAFPHSVSLALTGIISIVAAFDGSLALRNLSNLIGTTVPIALIVMSLMGPERHFHTDAALASAASLWCLIRTMAESKSRGYK
jgi:hypothetical protein